MATPSVSLVIPCMNEEKTIGLCITKAKKVFSGVSRNWEIIVSDSSTDASREIAGKMGARVISPGDKGYGIACLEGMKFARGDIIILADADDTYDFFEIPKFMEPLMKGDADLVIGTRLRGVIMKNAMPWLHRYIGNPVLTGCLNWIFKTGITDAHCGMRAITRDAFEKLDLKAAGMEFASEMLIEAATKKLRIREVPISYYPRQAPSKLHTWGDGWRHLRFIMLYNPTPFFYIPGMALFIFGVFMTATLSLQKNVEITRLHSIILGSMLILTGTQIVATGGYMKMYGIIHNKIEHNGITAKFLDYHSLEYGLLLGGILFFAGILLGADILIKWLNSGYGALSEVGQAVISLVLAGIGIQIVLSSLIISVFLLEKRNSK